MLLLDRARARATSCLLPLLLLLLATNLACWRLASADDDDDEGDFILQILPDCEGLINEIDEANAKQKELRRQMTRRGSKQSEKQDLHDQVHAQFGPTYKPEVLLQMLERIRDLTSDSERLEYCGALIEISNYNESNCNLNAFKHIEERIDKSVKRKTPNIFEFLIYHRGQLFSKCQAKLAKDVGKLSSQDREDMSALNDKILSANNVQDKQASTDSKKSAIFASDPQIWRSFLVEESLKLILRRAKETQLMAMKKYEDELESDKFTAEFKKTVGGLCKRVVGELTHSVAIFNLLNFDTDLLARLEPMTLEWMINARICRYISEQIHAVTDEAYQILLNENWKEFSKEMVKTAGDCKTNWNRILDSVFSQNAEELNPSITLTRLRKVKYVCAEKPEKEFEHKMKKVEELIDMSRITLANCTITAFSKYAKEIERNTPRATNIVKYLVFFRQRLLDYCDKKLKVAKNELDSETQDKMEKLANCIIVDTSKSTIDRKDVFKGIANYMSHHSGKEVERYISNKPENDLKNFKDDFNKIIGEMCKDILLKLSPWKRLYPFYMGDEFLLRELDSISTTWFTNARVCNEVMFDVEPTIKRAHSEVVKKNPSTRFFNRFLTGTFGW